MNNPEALHAQEIRMAVMRAQQLRQKLDRCSTQQQRRALILEIEEENAIVNTLKMQLFEDHLQHRFRSTSSGHQNHRNHQSGATRRVDPNLANAAARAHYHTSHNNITSNNNQVVPYHQHEGVGVSRSTISHVASMISETQRQREEMDRISALFTNPHQQQQQPTNNKQPTTFRATHTGSGSQHQPQHPHSSSMLMRPRSPSPTGTDGGASTDTEVLSQRVRTIQEAVRVEEQRRANMVTDIEKKRRKNALKEQQRELGEYLAELKARNNVIEMEARVSSLLETEKTERQALWVEGFHVLSQLSDRIRLQSYEITTRRIMHKDWLRLVGSLYEVKKGLVVREESCVRSDAAVYCKMRLQEIHDDFQIRKVSSSRAQVGHQETARNKRDAEAAIEAQRKRDEEAAIEAQRKRDEEAAIEAQRKRDEEAAIEAQRDAFVVRCVESVTQSITVSACHSLSRELSKCKELISSKQFNSVLNERLSALGIQEDDNRTSLLHAYSAEMDIIWHSFASRTTYLELLFVHQMHAESLHMEEQEAFQQITWLDRDERVNAYAQYETRLSNQCFKGVIDGVVRNAVTSFGAVLGSAKRVQYQQQQQVGVLSEPPPPTPAVSPIKEERPLPKNPLLDEKPMNFMTEMVTAKLVTSIQRESAVLLREKRARHQMSEAIETERIAKVTENVVSYVVDSVTSSSSLILAKKQDATACAEQEQAIEKSTQMLLQYLVRQTLIGFTPPPATQEDLPYAVTSPSPALVSSLMSSIQSNVVLSCAEALKNNNSCRLHHQQPRKVCVVGYGSLMNSASRKVTNPDANTHDGIVVKGYRRVWGVHTEGRTALGVVRRSGSNLYGVLTPITDIQALDRRETGYKRVKVDAADLCDPITLKPIQSDNTDYYIYEPADPPLPPDENNPVYLTYVDVIAAGVFELGPKFTEDFFQNNEGWGWIENDRANPQYPRAVNMSASTLSAIDKELERVLPPRRDYVIGYGSLMNCESRKLTDSGSEEVFPVAVSGYKRVWGKKNPNWTPIGVSTASKAAMVLGLCCRVTSMEMVDVREGGYTRTKVNPSDIMILSRKTNTPWTQSFYYRDNVYIYIPNTVVKPSQAAPILLSYVDVIAAGAIGLGDSFYHNFIEDSEGWTCILNDREQPQYGRYVPVDGKIQDKVMKDLKQYILPPPPKEQEVDATSVLVKTISNSAVATFANHLAFKRQTLETSTVVESAMMALVQQTAREFVHHQQTQEPSVVDPVETHAATITSLICNRVLSDLSGVVQEKALGTVMAGVMDALMKDAVKSCRKMWKKQIEQSEADDGDTTKKPKKDKDKKKTTGDHKKDNKDKEGKKDKEHKKDKKDVGDKDKETKRRAASDDSSLHPSTTQQQQPQQAPHREVDLNQDIINLLKKSGDTVPSLEQLLKAAKQSIGRDLLGPERGRVAALRAGWIDTVALEESARLRARQASNAQQSLSWSCWGAGGNKVTTTPSDTRVTNTNKVMMMEMVSQRLSEVVRTTAAPSDPLGHSADPFVEKHWERSNVEEAEVVGIVVDRILKDLVSDTEHWLESF